MHKDAARPAADPEWAARFRCVASGAGRRALHRGLGGDGLDLGSLGLARFLGGFLLTLGHVVFLAGAAGIRKRTPRSMQYHAAFSLDFQK